MIFIIFALFVSSLKKKIKACGDGECISVDIDGTATNYKVQIDGKKFIGSPLTIKYLDENDQDATNTDPFTGSNAENFKYQWTECTSTEASSCSTSLLGQDTDVQITIPATVKINSYIRLKVIDATDNTKSALSAAFGPIEQSLTVGLTENSVPRVGGTLEIGSVINNLVDPTVDVKDLAATSYKWVKCTSATECDDHTIAANVVKEGKTFYLDSTSKDNFYRVVAEYTIPAAGDTPASTITGHYTTPAAITAGLTVSITGVYVVGEDITADVPDLQASDENAVGYVWQKCSGSDGTGCSANGATGKTYKIASNQKDGFMNVKATGSGAYEGLSAEYTSDKAVVDLTPSISGDYSIGKKLTASIVSTTEESKVDFSWFKCDDTVTIEDTSSCTAIKNGETDATGKEIDLTSEQDVEGKKILLKVAGKSDGDYKTVTRSVLSEGVVSGQTSGGDDSSDSGNEPDDDNSSNSENQPDEGNSSNSENQPDEGDSSNSDGEQPIVPTSGDSNPPAACDIENCKKCNDADSSKCDECEPGYEISENGQTCFPLGCPPEVQNCQVCDKINRTICTKCNDDSQLRDGVCEKCENGLNEDGTCKADCSIIENCDKCKNENNYLICTGCKGDYVLSDDKRSCRQKTCQELGTGCLECSADNQSLCAKCNTDNHYELKDGKCQCSTDYPKESNGMCLTNNQSACLGADGIAFCLSCKDATACEKCIDNYRVNETTGKCDEIPCTVTIVNCTKCINNKCQICNEGYTQNADSSQCVEDKNIKCQTEIVGCKLCKPGNPNQCAECNEELHFIWSTDTQRCICDPKFDFVGNQCIAPVPPIMPPVVETEDLSKKEGYVLNGNTASVSFETTKGEQFPYEENKVYEYTVNNVNNEITLNNDIKLMKIVLPSSQALTIKPAEENKEITVDCSKGGDLTIPSGSSKVAIEGSGTVKINGAEGAQSVEVKKVVPDANGDLTLNSDSKELVLDTIQTFGKTKLTGNSNKDTNKVTKCKTLLLEGRSTLDAEKIEFEKIKVGLLSSLNLLSENADVSNSEITIGYNRPQPNPPFPIIFEKLPPAFKDGAKILIKRIESADSTIPENFEEGAEQVPLSQFKFNGDDQQKQAYSSCEELSKKFEGGEGFKTASCVNTTDSVNLVADQKVKDEPTPTKKKNKLSAGAIAGIVIACVVVVAAIIALLVYFLVIKKKNQSTTSTQGDSSIAI